MATTGGAEGPDLGLSEVAELLRSEPYRFDFFQAVRLLERLSPGRKSVGRFAPPSTEVVRFGASPTMEFPASQTQGLTARESGPPFLEVNFMGLTGPLGVLPHAYTEPVRERLRQEEAPPCVLGDAVEPAPQLGWSTWARSGRCTGIPMKRYLLMD